MYLCTFLLSVSCYYPIVDSLIERVEGWHMAPCAWFPISPASRCRAEKKRDNRYAPCLRRKPPRTNRTANQMKPVQQVNQMKPPRLVEDWRRNSRGIQALYISSRGHTQSEVCTEARARVCRQDATCTGLRLSRAVSGVVLCCSGHGAERVAVAKNTDESRARR